MGLIKQMKIRSLTKKLKAMQHNRKMNAVNDDLLKKEIAMYELLGKKYKSLIGKKKYPFASQMVNECMRAAAAMDHAESQYLLGQQLLEEAKFREKLEQEELFANPSNKRMATQLYEEAHAYLLAAQNLEHVLAKRLRGLCYINGWGVETDKNKGFELVVASIEQEGSWDKVPQIFAAIGLNKPEFFTALMKHRGKN
ncbi:hypothetical protein ACFORL_00260 [Legionella dresdenensis]|uniref:Uncharacterized protein n=1 Tax=Legionella dresdenensis TaxID=450200 RepID=A0ABV8CB36_9GAMM